MNAYEQGAEAIWELEGNPYPPGTQEHLDWQEGYDDNWEAASAAAWEGYEP